jgi:hypothetical protein
MHAPAARVAARVPADAGVVQAVDEHTCTLLAGSNSLDGLALHVALLGFDFTVHEPAELIERFRVLHGRIGNAVSSR